MIPEAFLDRMRGLLGEEFPAFCEALLLPSRHALRGSLAKGATDALLRSVFPELTPLPFVTGGYLIPEGLRPGAHPLHHAGAYYMQDPSAMAAVAALPFPIGGWRVLDLCAAPGGKTSQLSDAVGDGGFLLSNEIVRSRAMTLLGNIERLGIKNTAVTSLDPREVSSLFDRYFDLAVVDAPCSGEGMFRKYPEAAAEWSPAAVEAAAARGRLVLEEAARTVREGGYLLFSTCTFSEEENEETVTDFLARHPEFTLRPLSPAVTAITAPGITRPHRPREITLTRRFYPHLAPGEGQYIALLERTAGGCGDILYRPLSPLTGREEREAREALRDLLVPPSTPLYRLGDTLLTAPGDMPVPTHGLIRAGVALATLRAKLLLPHHHAASALGRAFCRTLPLSLDDGRLFAYLHGEEIAAEGAPSGFAAVLVEGLPLGLTKCSHGRAKNHYPKGLRTP